MSLGVKLIGSFGEWTCEPGLVSASTKNSWVSLSGAMKLFSYADSHSVLQMAMLVCQLSKSLKLGPRKAWNWGEEDVHEERSWEWRDYWKPEDTPSGLLLAWSWGAALYIGCQTQGLEKSWWTSEPRINIASIYWAPTMELAICQIISFTIPFAFNTLNRPRR